jgi:hypothetical protein
MLDGPSLDGRSDPHLPKRKQHAVSKELSHAIWPLGKNLEVMLGALSHHFPN